MPTHPTACVPRRGAPTHPSVSWKLTLTFFADPRSSGRERRGQHVRGTRDPGCTVVVMWLHLQVSLPTKVSAPCSSAAWARAQHGAMRGCPSPRAAAGRRARGGGVPADGGRARGLPLAPRSLSARGCCGFAWGSLPGSFASLGLRHGPMEPSAAPSHWAGVLWQSRELGVLPRAPACPLPLCSPLTPHCPTPSPRLPVWENKPPRGNPISTTKKDGARFT